MRVLNELYSLLYERIKDYESMGGICTQITFLCLDRIITPQEFDVLRHHFNTQKPSRDQHQEFFNHPRFTGGIWWWSGEEAKDPVNRKAFIKKLMETKWEKRDT